MFLYSKDKCIGSIRKLSIALAGNEGLQGTMLLDSFYGSNLDDLEIRGSAIISDIRFINQDSDMTLEELKQHVNRSKLSFNAKSLEIEY